jgi:hypothetical protein
MTKRKRGSAHPVPGKSGPGAPGAQPQGNLTPGGSPGNLVDPKKIVKIEKDEMFGLININRGLDQNMRKLSLLQREYHKELKSINKKLDLIEEQSEEYVKRLRLKYKFIGELKTISAEKLEIILE